MAANTGGLFISIIYHLACYFTAHKFIYLLNYF